MAYILSNISKNIHHPLPNRSLANEIFLSETTAHFGHFLVGTSLVMRLFPCSPFIHVESI